MKSITVVIPTYNAGSLLKEVLKNIFEQTVKPIEVIIIDSSSSDGTDKIAKKFPVKFYEIDKKSFGHGKTRNYGAKLAKGDYVVFLTQDAVPRNKDWLKNLVANLGEDEVAGTFSRQIAREHAIPMEKFFYSQMYPTQARRFTKKNLLTQDILFSNASSAIKRTYILDHPFAEDILMSEDYEWALRALRSGDSILYEASSQVTHSHDTTFKMLFKRYFDFGVSHNEIKTKQESVSFISKGLAIVIAEIKYLYIHGNAVWIPQSLSYNAAKFLGLTIGKNHRKLPRALKLRLTSNYKEYWT